MYDIFISYRRDGGHEMARLIYEHLSFKGLNCFFDLEELGAGEFNIKLLKNIEESRNFVLILSPGALDRCRNENDWVRAEIEHAIENEKNIVPLMMKGFDWPGDLPESLSKLPFYNGVSLIREYFDASINKLVGMLELDRDIDELQNNFVMGRVDEITPLVKRAYIFLEDRAWSSADEYAEKVLDKDPENADAYLIKLMAELRVPKREALGKFETPFNNSNYYKKAIRFANDTLKKELLGYIEQINQRRRSYLSAKDLLEYAENLDDYEIAAKKFADLGEYEDSVTLSAACLKVREIFEKAEDNESFKNRYDLNRVYIPKGVNSIGKGAFFGCSGITQLKVSDGVKTVNISAFSGCSKLMSITLPDSIESIGSSAFLNTEYYNNPSNWENGVLYIGNHLISAKDTLSGHYTIKSGTITIADFAFSRCSKLTGITIPNSVKNIGSNAFYNCENLDKVNIPDHINVIGGLAFLGCKSLSDITIGSGLRYLGQMPFVGCSSLKNISVSENNSFFKSIDGDMYSKDGNEFIQYAIGKSAPSFEFPDSVTTVSFFSFSDCKNIRNITLSKNVQNVSGTAFFNCHVIENFTVSEDNSSYASINGNLYSKKCDKLIKYATGRSDTEFEIPDGVTEISDFAFFNCLKLSSLTIPNSVTSIGHNAFSKCNALKNFVYKGKKEQWDNVEKNEIGYSDKITFVCEETPKSEEKTPEPEIKEIKEENKRSEPEIKEIKEENKRSEPEITVIENKESTENKEIKENTDSKTDKEKKNEKKKKKGCYIATCVYGSYDAPQVWTLRRFRDDSLASSFFGRLFIRSYYAISPAVVKCFGNTRWFKKLWRAALDRIVAKLQKRGVEDTPYKDKEW